MRSVPILLLIVAFVGSQAKAEQCAYSEYRLPKHIRPSHYDVTFDMDLNQPNFGGSVKIDLKVNDESDKAPKNVIVLHAAPTLDVSEVHYHPNGDDKSDLVDSICRDAENEQLVVTLKESLSSGSQGSLEMLFKAEYRVDYRGIFKSTFTLAKGRNQVYASSIFAPADARKAFPCFDEPSFKATFDLTLIHDAKKVALANTAVKSVATDETTKLQTTKFNTTPLMSTYLVGFAIGDFEFEEKKIGKQKIPVRFYFRPNKKYNRKYALDTAARTIALLENYFDIPYPMDKLDFVALPGVSRGKAAMENWGFITFDEASLLDDWAQLAQANELRIAAHVVHELAHQWFGHLVTLKWWDDVWLKEGFATWMEEFIINHLYPEIGIDYYNLIHKHEAALDADTKLDTHPIKFEHVEKTSDDIFSDIVRLKSTSIFSYLHDDFIGAEKFVAGLRSFLKKHMYGNVKASDFWDELTAVSVEPVDTFLKSWLDQAGHPLVRVDLDSQGRKLVLEQSRHLPTKDAEENDQKWMIPLTVLVSDGKGRQETLERIFDQKTMEVELPEWFNPKSKDHWLVLNENARGFYRVLYEDKLLQKLAKPCSSKQLSMFARSNLVDELRSHYENGLIDIGKLKDSLSWFKSERDGIVLMNLARAFRALLGSTEGFVSKFWLHETGRKLFMPIYDEDGLSIERRGTSLTDKLGLEDVFCVLVEIGREPVINEALHDFEEFYESRLIGLRRLNRVMVEAVKGHGSTNQKERLSKVLKSKN